MSAIGKLEAELTRLGVEYDFTDRLHEIPSYQSVTWWFNTADKAKFMEFHDGSTQLIVRSIKSGVTPEEAIAATLGSRECHKVWRKDGYGFCSECGYNITGAWAHYCPNCGRKVISE